MNPCSSCIYRLRNSAVSALVTFPASSISPCSNWLYASGEFANKRLRQLSIDGRLRETSNEVSDAVSGHAHLPFSERIAETVAHAVAKSRVRPRCFHWKRIGSGASTVLQEYPALRAPGSTPRRRADSRSRRL